MKFDLDVYDAIDYEKVKSTIKVFTDYERFIELLIKRGWGIQKRGQTTLFVKPNGKTYYLNTVLAQWKLQRNEMLQSLKSIGFEYNHKTKRFTHDAKDMSLDEVYDAIKVQVVDQFISYAKSKGFIFHIEEGEFFKYNLAFSVQEVLIRVNLNHIDL